MEERQPSKIERKRDRQAISIPFIWEVKPGTPKKDWKPGPRPVTPPTPPVKLFVSVPFRWEEKPGIPLPYLTQPPKESMQQEHSIMLWSPPVLSDPEEEDGYWSAGEGVIDDQSEDEQGGLPGAYSNKIDDYSSSTPCLLANGLISTTRISGAVPVQQNALALVPVNYYGQLQCPGSPVSETDTTTDSCITRNSSLVGASFLEWLFPLLVPNSSYSDPSQKSDMVGTNFLHESNCSQVGRPILTLGELIVMSRRRSCQRKNVKMHKQSSMDFTKGAVLGCFIFGSGNGISGLQRKWKRRLQPKLVQKISLLSI